MEYNFTLVKLYADFLNSTLDIEDSIKVIMATGVDDVLAERLFVAECCGLDTFGKDRTFFQKYFPLSLRKEFVEDYLSNPYLNNIVFKVGKKGNITFEKGIYKPYQPFVYNDLFLNFDGMIIPQVGFFTKEFSFPRICENGREWMTITPNEINTMKKPISLAKGRVLCLGLGLGYFAYMCSLKSEVEEIVVIERNPVLIELFKEFILSQFSFKEKVKVIEGDAFDYLKNPSSLFDFVFADLWHDCGDGVDLYLELKKYEDKYPKALFTYWIEDSMKFYL